jgi:hypothetical protein
MISHEQKIIFIHLPKCGGTTIEVALTDTGWQKGELYAQQHLTARETRDLYGEKVFANYHKFAVVRNTWDLLVSHYLWGGWGPFGNLEKWFHYGGMWGHPYSLKKLRLGRLPTFAEYLSNLHGYNRKLNFNRSQADLTFQLDALSIDGKLAVDYLGRFENLQKDFDLFCNKVGINPKKLRPVHKSTRKKHYSEFYNQKTRDFVAQKFKGDIEFFKFRFDCF